MSFRTHPIRWSIAFTLALTAVISGFFLAKPWLGNADHADPLVVYCASATQAPMQAIASDYQEETGQAVELRVDASGTLLTNLRPGGPGDLFLPADTHYIDQAKKRNLLAEVFPLARMRAVLIVNPDYPVTINSFHQLLQGKIRLAQADPNAAAIGMLTRKHLTKNFLWPHLRKYTKVFKATASDVAEAVQKGSVDAGIVWDAVAHQYPDLTMVRLSEFRNINAQVHIAVVKGCSHQTSAAHFARFVAAHDQGLARFGKNGFAVLDRGGVDVR